MDIEKVCILRGGGMRLGGGLVGFSASEFSLWAGDGARELVVVLRHQALREGIRGRTPVSHRNLRSKSKM